MFPNWAGYSGPGRTRGETKRKKTAQTTFRDDLYAYYAIYLQHLLLTRQILKAVVNNLPLKYTRARHGLAHAVSPKHRTYIRL